MSIWSVPIWLFYCRLFVSDLLFLFYFLLITVFFPFFRPLLVCAGPDGPAGDAVLLQPDWRAHGHGRQFQLGALQADLPASLCQGFRRLLDSGGGFNTCICTVEGDSLNSAGTYRANVSANRSLMIACWIWNGANIQGEQRFITSRRSCQLKETWKIVSIQIYLNKKFSQGLF